MVGVFLFLLHLPSFRDHGLEVVGITVIPRLDGVVTFAADEAKALRNFTSYVEIPSTHSNADVDADPTVGWQRVQCGRGLYAGSRVGSSAPSTHGSAVSDHFHSRSVRRNVDESKNCAIPVTQIPNFR